MSYIKRETLLQKTKELLSDDAFGAARIVREIKRAPAEDVVEVVRCKDCKYFRRWNDGSTTCLFWTDQWDMATEPNGFCSYSERRTDNE